MRKHSTDNDASALINHNAYFTSCYESARVKYANIRKHSTDSDANALIEHSAYSAWKSESTDVACVNTSEHSAESNASAQEERSNNVKKNHEGAYNDINFQREESVMSILINLRDFKAMFAVNNDRVINSKIVFNEFTEKRTCRDESELRALMIIFNIATINATSIKLEFVKLRDKNKCCAHEHSRDVSASMNVNAFMNVVNVNAFINMFQLNATKIWDMRFNEYLRY